MDVINPVLDVLGVEEGYTEAAINALILSTMLESWRDLDAG